MFVQPMAYVPLLLTLLVTGCTLPPRTEQPPTRAAVSRVTMTVSDIDRVLPFYTEVLSFVVVKDTTTDDPSLQRALGVEGAMVRTVTLQLGQEQLELMDFLKPEGDPYPAHTRSNDRWFQHVAIIVSDMDAAYELLQQHGVKPASQDGPQRLPDWNPNAGGIEAYYFRDPDGHYLEILAFPPGKGDPRWQSKDRLFLGMDHTAIVVEDTDRSLRLYRDLLGLRVIGTSENYGPEQERLNHVFGARLRITALRGDTGMAIEFLEYLSPSTGRSTPVELAVNDVSHWHVTLETPALDRVERASRESDFQWISPGVVEFTPPRSGTSSLLVGRDRDGHGLLLRDSAR